MKKIYFAFLFTFICAFGFAQAPKLINYQGIARDASGAAITSTVIGLRFEISLGGSVVYTEDQVLNTNALGLFSTQIGNSPGSNLNIDWENGAYKLQVYIDLFNNGNFIAIGIPQPIASVPYALHAASVPASYSNNILSIGSHTISLPTPTINGAGIASVSSDSNTGANYTVSVPAPTLSLNNDMLSISNGNTVNLLPETNITSSGIASVTSAGTNSFNVDVPAPVLAISGNNISISNGNSITIPQTTVTSSSGVAIVTSLGTNSFDINVPAPQLAINGTSLSIVGSNSVSLATSFPQTSVNASGIAIAGQTVSPGLNVFDVNVPLPTYNGTVLSYGASNTLNIAPTLSLSGTTLYSGLLSNSVNLASSSPWKIGTVAPNSVLLNTPGMPVGIGGSTMTSASALLDVEGTSSTSGAIIKAINSNASNTFQVLDIQNTASGGLGMNIVTAPTGDGAHFQSYDGYALHTQNNSSTYPAFYAKNNGTGSAGYFIGGFLSQGSTSTSAGYAIQAQNSAASPLFAVRNDAAVSIGAFSVTPGAKLDLNGALRVNDGTQALGKVLTSDANGLASWQSIAGIGNWGLTGNAGTTPSLNFIGTTDLQPLNFRVNNTKAGTIDPVLANNAFGLQALFANTTGNYNNAVGTNALQNNTTGNYNNAIGYSALSANTTGSGNNAFGYAALSSNTAGGNSAFGDAALNLNTTGTNNNAFGNGALSANTTGGNNSAFGSGALLSNVTGNLNTALGYNANVSTGTLTNATAIGANATVSASNRVKLGNNADVQFDKSLMPAGNAGNAGQVLQSNGAGIPPTWVGALPGIKHVDVNITNVSMVVTATLGTLSMTLPGPGYVVAHFDGYAYVDPSSTLLLAASDNGTWGVNNGHSSVSNNTSFTEQRSFSHTMYYTISSSGTYIYYATGTLFGGSGLASVYGHLTVTYYPLQY